MAAGKITLSTLESPYKLGEQLPSKGSSLLFKGIFNDKIPIVFKRYQISDQNSNDYQRDLTLLSSPENRHPNFIRYFGHAVDSEFK